jgi:hypothetical protein
MEFLDIVFPLQSPVQTHALVFVLGSLAVSSLSDLRRMAAQADFAEVWGAFTALMFAADVYMGLLGQLGIEPFILKWLIIAGFAVVTTSTRALSICTMDIAAILALISSLGPGYIILTLIALLIVNELLQPILKSYGEAGAYPFLPTVFAVNLIVLAATAFGGVEAFIR